MKKGEDFTGITVVYFCHDGNGKFLFNKRNEQCRDEHNRWDTGGGGLEIHDSVEDTLRKEILEEYCTDVLDFEFLGFRDIHRENGDTKTHWVSLDFKVLIDKEKVQNGEPHKFSEIKWFTADTIPEEELHSQLPHFIEKYKGRLFS